MALGIAIGGRHGGVLRVGVRPRDRPRGRITMPRVERDPVVRGRGEGPGAEDGRGASAGQFIQGPPEAIVGKVLGAAPLADEPLDIGPGQAIRDPVQRGVAHQQVSQQYEKALPRRHPAVGGVPAHLLMDDRDDADCVGELPNERRSAHDTARRFNNGLFHKPKTSTCSGPFHLRHIPSIINQNWKNLGAEYVIKHEGGRGMEKTSKGWDAADPVPRRRRFRTLSGIPLRAYYTAQDLPPEDAIGQPGHYPYTRGIHETMYRGRLWTMRQFAGFGTARDTNQRFRYLLDQGQTGLSVAFDMPTLMGYDSDDPHSLGEVGREGVAIDTVEDMERLFEGINLGQVSTSMTINGPAPILWAMYLVVAERQGVPWSTLRGTLQADILKEYIAQKEWLFPPEPSMREMVDLMAFATREVPQWNSVSISGYHIREAGATAAQELAFTLANGFAYVEAGIAAGLDVNVFAPRLSFFFNAHMDFFEEIAKFRAARRIWARHLKERYGASNPKAWMLRFHTQTAGCSLTAQQPENNIIRTAFEALAAVLGGTQSLHTNSMDEVLSLPTEKAAKIALRTQQIIAYETGVAIPWPAPLLRR